MSAPLLGQGMLSSLLVDGALASPRKTIEENRQKVQSIAQALLKYETLSGDDVRRIVAGQTLDKPTVEDLLRREETRPPASASPLPATGSPGIPPLVQPG